MKPAGTSPRRASSLRSRRYSCGGRTATTRESHVDMTNRMAGRVALITGAGTGIGAATARRLVAEGANVVLCGRRPDPLHEVAAELGDAGFVAPGDAARTEDAQRVVADGVQRYGRLDLL